MANFSHMFCFAFFNSHFLSYKEKTSQKMKKIIRFIFYYSDIIVTYTFAIYVVIYVIFRLDDIIICNYIMIGLLCLYLGYKFARKSYDYLRKHNNEQSRGQ